MRAQVECPENSGISGSSLSPFTAGGAAAAFSRDQGFGVVHLHGVEKFGGVRNGLALDAANLKVILRRLAQREHDRVPTSRTGKTDTIERHLVCLDAWMLGDRQRVAR